MVAFPVDDLVPDPEMRQRLELILREKYHIEIPMIRWRPAPDTDRWTIRVSCQIYNDDSDMERLATALAASRTANHGAMLVWNGGRVTGASA